MAKTTFSSGVIVTSQWLNGAKQIYFDGADLDWHYPPLGLDSLQFSGAHGLDSRYVTLAGEQSGCYGTPPISGSFTTNAKFEFANGVPFPTFDQKFSSLNNADLITKEILVERFKNLFIDNGFYARADSTCNNYAGTAASNQCPIG